MSNVYEQIGRRVVGLLAQNAEFAASKGQQPKKKNCGATSHSCGFSCISGKKVCRISMTLEQQKAAKELKKELGVNIAPKPVPTSSKAIDPDKMLKDLEATSTEKSGVSGLEAGIDRLKQLQDYSKKELKDSDLYPVFEETVRIGAMADPATAAAFGNKIYSKLSEAQKDKLAEDWHEANFDYARPGFEKNPHTKSIADTDYIKDIDARIKKIRVRDEWE